jgi:hypothetical protein
MRVLEVFGDDYAATGFEELRNNNKINPVEMWEKAKKEGQQVYEDDEFAFEWCAYEFGEVDPKFIDFVHDTMQDYDDSKHHNFYVL